MRIALFVAGMGVAALAGSGPAMADPEPPADPAAPAGPQTVLGAELQVNPIDALTGLLATSSQPPALGAPGADPMAFTGLLMPQNYRMPASDQTSPYPLAPNSEPSPFARIDAWKGVHALTHGGLGRMPGEELGQPLPGTAAPPGSNLPPGLEQFYIDPALPTPPSP